MKNKNTVINDDFLNNDLPDGCADLIIADPPYFEVKGGFDFVWDNFEDYLKDVEKWAQECKRLLKENGSLFWWGHARKIAYSQIILDKYFNLQNVIKWRKTDCQTRKGVETFRCFPPVTEHLLFYSQDQLNLTSSVSNIRDYLRSEIEKARGKIVFKEINAALGTATNGGGVASAILSLDKSEPLMVTKEHYEKLQKWLNPYLDKPYEFLRDEYEQLRAEYEEKRRPFNNYLKLEDVWDYAQDVHITGKYDHETKKPEKLARIIINTCSRPGDLVIIPFAGSGTECAMAAKEKRQFVGYEIDPKYATMSAHRVRRILREPELF